MFEMRVIIRYKRFEEKAEREISEFGEQLRESIRREGIRHSKYGLAKLIGLEAIPIVWGATLGGIGRSTGADWVPVAPLAIDFMWNAQGYLSLRGLWDLAKYGLGVSLPYADKIYMTAQTLSDKF